jgi:hypothetical protein
MAYLMYKCFGSSSYDPTDVIYNVDDAFNMLSSQELAELITESLEAEDALANAAVLPNGKPVRQQLPGDNKGQVDAMFRGFLAADPMRYFMNGKQIPGLFETNFVQNPNDPPGGGNWCLTVGDKIEVPLQLVFRAPVSVLSVQDNVQNPSSATPDSVQTTMIPGEVATFDCTSQKAAPANVIPIRLQITCGAPAGTAGSGSTSAPNADVPLSIPTSSSVIFYTPKNYGAQNAIAMVAAGGTGALTYSMVLPADLSAGVTINASSGMLSFDAKAVAESAAPVNKWGKWAVPVTVTDSASPPVSLTRYVNVSLEDGNGASNNSLWLSAESAKIGVAASLAPYFESRVVASTNQAVAPRQALLYASPPYGQPSDKAALLVDEVLSKDTLTFTYAPPPANSLGPNMPAVVATSAVWSITSESGKSGSAALPAGVTFAPSGLTASLNVNLDHKLASPDTGADYSGAVPANKPGLYSFLVTARDNNNYVQSFPVTLNIAAPPLRNADAPLTAASPAGTQASYANGSILRYAVGGTDPLDVITLTNTNDDGGAWRWSVAAVFGSVASMALDSAVVLKENTLTINASAAAGTHSLLVTCVDAQNISQTIFYTVVYA